MHTDLELVETPALIAELIKLHKVNVIDDPKKNKMVFAYQGHVDAILNSLSWGAGFIQCMKQRGD